MNIEELRRNIENEGLQAAQGYEELFNTTLYDVVKASKKIKPNYILNSIAYDNGQRIENKEVIQQLCVVYSIVAAQGVFNVALGLFDVKETEVEDFLEYAQSKEVLSAVEINLAEPENVEFVLSNDQKIKFSTIAVQAKNNNSKIVRGIPEINDCLWKVVEKNYKHLLKEKQQEIIDDIAKKKFLKKEIKKEKEAIQGYIDRGGKKTEVMQDGYIFGQHSTKAEQKVELKKANKAYEQVVKNITDLKSKRELLKQKNANKNLDLVFGDKK